MDAPGFTAEQAVYRTSRQYVTLSPRANSPDPVVLMQDSPTHCGSCHCRPGAACVVVGGGCYCDPPGHEGE
jgi:hypothetical protein